VKTVSAANEHPEDRRVGRDAVQPEGAAERVHVLEDDADDLAEAQRDQRQVVALQPQRRDADGEARQRRRRAPGEQRPEEEQPLLRGACRRPDPEQLRARESA
jgi:hypothetical protein